MKKLLLIPFLCLVILPSCGITKIFDTLDRVSVVMTENKEDVRNLVENITKITGKINRVTKNAADSYDKITKVVSDKINTIKETISAADTNEDGKLSWMEIIAMLGLGGGGGGILLRNRASKKAKDDVNTSQDIVNKEVAVKLTDIQIEIARNG